MLRKPRTNTSVPLAFLPGGVPLRDRQAALCGAVGVGEGTPEQDQAVAAAEAWRKVRVSS